MFVGVMYLTFKVFFLSSSLSFSLFFLLFSLSLSFLNEAACPDILRRNYSTSTITQLSHVWQLPSPQATRLYNIRNWLDFSVLYNKPWHRRVVKRQPFEISMTTSLFQVEQPNWFHCKAISSLRIHKHCDKELLDSASAMHLNSGKTDSCYKKDWQRKAWLSQEQIEIHYYFLKPLMEVLFKQL